MERLCALLRSAQASVLSKLRAERPTEVDYMNVFMEHTQIQVSSFLNLFFCT